MPELETPANVEIDDVSGEDPTYRRIVAVFVVLITLFGSIVAYLHAVESNIEDNSAREAQRDAIAGLGSQVDASADFAADLLISSDVDAQLQRQALNAGRVNAINGDVDSDVHLAASQRYAAVQAAIADLTPIDPADPSTIDDDLAQGNESADAARLLQTVEADRANDHGGKADRYVAVLAVLAVSLFLIGLSLTVEGRSRFVLVTPGVAIAAVCLVWTLLIASSDILHVGEHAVRAAAEGQRLQDAGDLEGAIDAYDDAIDESPDFAAAYARRAGARFEQGSAQVGQTGFLSITSEEALEDALADLDRALDLGADSDVNTVGDAGFFHFLAGDFDEAVRLSHDALDLNDRLATIWFNLGVAEVAQGHEREALRAYREGRHLLEDVPDKGTRSGVLSGARTDLSVLREILDGDELDDVLDLVHEVEGELAAFEASFVDVPCDAEPCPTADEVGGDVEPTDAEFSRNGATVFADYTLDGVEAGTPIANVWYLRTDEDLPFEQAAFSTDIVRAGDGGSVSTATLPSFDPACPVGGEYLVRVYAGQRLLGEVDGTVDPSPFGDEFTSVVDPIEGYDACVPVDFTVERADVSELDAFTGFNGPEFIYGLNVTPGAAIGQFVNRDALVEAMLTGSLEIDASELVPVTLSGRDLEGNFVAMDGLAGQTVSDGIGLMAAAAIGPDGAARTVTISGLDDLDMLFEAISLIEFTGLPVQEP